MQHGCAQLVTFKLAKHSADVGKGPVMKSGVADACGV